MINHTTSAALTPVLILIALCAGPQQVIADDGAKADKRQVSVMARDGQLPYEGKRYVGEKQQQPEQERTWLEQGGGQTWLPTSDDLPSVYLMAKRYVGALAKSGDLVKFKQQDDKREDVDTIIDELLTADELKKIRLEALRDEVLREEEEEEEAEEKRSLSSLARSGSLPSKRSVAAMARAGNLGPFGKRGISSLARNGELSVQGKRGGISSLMRNGKRFDSDLDSVDEYDLDDKRNVASLARGYSLPSPGKKNIASFARNGWLRQFGPNAKKSYYFDWQDDLDEGKRNLPSLLKNRFAFNRPPYYDLDEKRNLGSMARNFNLPQRHFYGKRYWMNADDNAIFGKRFDDEDDDQPFDDWDSLDEQKRHIGSFLAQKSFAMRKKKSISPEDQFGAPPFSTPSSTVEPLSDENKMNNDIRQTPRSKRDASAEPGEYSEQNDDVTEDVYGGSRGAEEQNARQKRYFGALARSGWLPRAHRPMSSSVGKRHIGALARMGWLPSFRSVRAYNRFGRDTRSPCKRAEPPLSEGWREDSGRAAASRGKVSLQQPQLWATSPLGYRPNQDDDDDGDDDDDEIEEREWGPVKRYLLIPALDNILLRRQPINWIH